MLQVLAVLMVVGAIGYLLFSKEIQSYSQDPITDETPQAEPVKGTTSSNLLTASQRIESIRRVNLNFQSETTPIQLEIIERKLSELAKIEKLLLTDADRARYEETEVELLSLDYYVNTNAGIGSGKHLERLQEIAEVNADSSVSNSARRLALDRIIDVPLKRFSIAPGKETKEDAIAALRKYGLSAISYRKDRDKIFQLLKQGITKLKENEDYRDVADTVVEIAESADSDVGKSFGHDVQWLSLLKEFNPALLRHSIANNPAATIERMKEWVELTTEQKTVSIRAVKKFGFLLELLAIEQPAESQAMLQELKETAFDKANAFEKAELIQFFNFQQRRIGLLGKKLADVPDLPLKNGIEKLPLKVFAFINFYDGQQIVDVKPLITDVSNSNAAYNLYIVNTGKDDEAVQEIVKRGASTKATFYASKSPLPIIDKLGLRNLPGGFMVVVDENDVVRSVPTNTIGVLKCIDELAKQSEDVALTTSK